MKNLFFKFILVITGIALIVGFAQEVKGQAYTANNNYGNLFNRINVNNAFHLPHFTSGTSSAVVTNLVKNGALAYNTTDGKLYYSSNGITYDTRLANFAEISGGGVTSLNSLSGALTIANGTGIGVNSVGSTITISNTGVTSIGGNTGALLFANGTGINVGFSGSTYTFTNTGVTSVNGNTGAIQNVWTQGGNNFSNVNNVFGTTQAGDRVVFRTGGVDRGIMSATGEFVWGGTSFTTGYHFDMTATNKTNRSQNIFTGTASNVAFSIEPAIAQSGTAGYTGLLVNATESSTGSGNKWLANFQVGGADRARVRNTGLFDGIGMGNITSSTNALMSLATTGTTFSRNMGDANHVFSITNLHASSTGDIFRANNSAGNVFRIKQNGKVSIIDGTQANNYVLKSDANGEGTWVDVNTLVSIPAAQDINSVLTTGDILNANRGINQSTFTFTHIAQPNKLKFVTGNQGSGKVWTSDGSGGGDWLNPLNQMQGIESVLQTNNIFSMDNEIDLDDNNFSIGGYGGTGKLRFVTGNEGNGKLWVSDAFGGGDWVSPGSIITNTPGWNQTLNVDNIANNNDAYFQVTGGTRGVRFVNGSFSQKGYFIYRPGSGTSAGWLNEAETQKTLINPADVTVQDDNTAESSYLHPDEIAVRNIPLTSDQSTTGGIIHAYNRYTSTSNNNTSINWSLKLTPGQWIVFEAEYVGLETTGKVASGKLWGSVIHAGGVAAIQNQADIAPLATTIAGGQVKIAVSGDNVQVTTQSGSAGTTTWEVDIKYTIHQ